MLHASLLFRKSTSSKVYMYWSWHRWLSSIATCHVKSSTSRTSCKQRMNLQNMSSGLLIYTFVSFRRHFENPNWNHRTMALQHIRSYQGSPKTARLLLPKECCTAEMPANKISQAIVAIAMHPWKAAPSRSCSILSFPFLSYRKYQGYRFQALYLI